MKVRTEKDREHRVLVVGNDPVAAAIAQSVTDTVQFVGATESVVDRAAAHVSDAVHVDDPVAFSPSEPVDTAIIATAADRTNLLATQRLRLNGDPGEVVVRLNDPTNRSAFAELNVETVCAATTVGEAFKEVCMRAVESGE